MSIHQFWKDDDNGITFCTETLIRIRKHFWYLNPESGCTFFKDLENWKSLILKNQSQDEFKNLILFSGVNEFEAIKKNYTKFVDAYGCLGVLRINEGKKNHKINNSNSCTVFSRFFLTPIFLFFLSYFKVPLEQVSDSSCFVIAYLLSKSLVFASEASFFLSSLRSQYFFD